jgi:hypothetical protein
MADNGVRWLTPRWIVTFAALGTIFLASIGARAQQKTFYLDRLTVGGSPDDGIAIWRPYEAPKTRVFGQMALGLTLRPLRVTTVTTDNNPRLRNFSDAVVGTQFIDYATIGAEIAGRATISVTLPFTLFQSGLIPLVGVRGVGLQPFALMDARLDLRGMVYETADKKWLFGAGMSIYMPIGSRFSYGGDGAASTAINVSVETYVRDVIVAVNTGIHWRPSGVIGELTVGDEWTLGVGAYLPLREGKYRVGG